MAVPDGQEKAAVEQSFANPDGCPREMAFPGSRPAFLKSETRFDEFRDTFITKRCFPRSGGYSQGANQCPSVVIERLYRWRNPQTRS